MTDDATPALPLGGARLTIGVACGVAVVALLVRWWTLGALLGSDPLLRAPPLDDAAYLDFARDLHAGRPHDWFLAPLHPWLGAQAARFATLDLELLCRVNLFIGALTSAALCLLGTALHSRPAGVIAGLLHALAGAFVFVDVTPGQEPVIGLLTVAAVGAAVALRRRPGAWPALLFGLSVGLAALGRGTSLALLLAAIPALRQGTVKERLRLAALCGVGLLAALLPAAMANQTANGRLSPLPWSGGTNLYLGNGPDARRYVAFTSDRLGDRPDLIAARSLSIPEGVLGRDLDRGEASRWWMGETWRERGPLGGFALHLLRKTALIFEADEQGSNHSVLVERDFAPWLRFSPVHGWWLLALGVGAWWLARRRSPELDVAAWAAAGTALTLVVFFPVARYRMPIVTLAAAAVGVGAAVLLRRRPPRRRILVAGGLVAVVTVAAWLPVRESDHAIAHVNVASAHQIVGDSTAVITSRLRTALRESPTCGPAHEFLGRILLEQGDPARAYEHLAQAERDSRTRYGAQVASIRAAVLLGRADEAWRTASTLLRGGTDDPELFAYAALAAYVIGRPGDARSLFETAVQASPDHPAVLWVQTQMGR